MNKLKTFVLFFVSFNVWSMGANDLSILLPLSQDQNIHHYLAPWNDGEKGELLSREIYRKLLRLLPEFDNETTWKDQLRVVAIRLDPCFFEGRTPLACRKQLRLVWQPLTIKDGRLTTRDAAIHSFYEFSDSEFSEVVSEWKKWAQTDSKEPLGIHPVIATQGMNGVSWKSLKEIILRFCGDENLVRMTSMTVTGNEMLWIFNGFDKVGNVIREITIPRIEERIQSITQSAFNYKAFVGDITPTPNHDQEFIELIQDSNWFKRRATDQAKFKAVRASFEYENPKIHNTGTLDCASCHIANMAQEWSRRHLPIKDWEDSLRGVRYQSKFNLKNPTLDEFRPNQFRVFGYFEHYPAISQRVINETSEVSEYIKKMPLKK